MTGCSVTKQACHCGFRPHVLFGFFNVQVNTASRIESAGEGGQIHLSKQTADILISRGLERWVTKRTDPVAIKGKGG